MSPSFSSRVLAWFAQPDDAVRAAELMASCEEAWASNERGNQDAVMRFVFFRRDPVGFPYLASGLSSSDPATAIQAVGYVASLIIDGLDFHEDVHRALMDCAKRYPDLRPLVEYVAAIRGRPDKTL